MFGKGGCEFYSISEARSANGMPIQLEYVAFTDNGTLLIAGLAFLFTKGPAWLPASAFAVSPEAHTGSFSLISSMTGVQGILSDKYCTFP